MSSHAEFHMMWPLGLLNRGTERRGSDEERTPSRFKSRASTDEVGSSRRRAHTTGEREAAEAQGNTLAHSSRSSVEPVQGSKRCARARRTTTERLGANRFREVHALCEALRASLGSRCVQGMGNRHVSGIQDLTSLSNGVQCRLST